MLFGTSKKPHSAHLPEIRIGNETLEHVQIYKYLGLLLDSVFSWKATWKKIRQKIRQRLGIWTETYRLYCIYFLCLAIVTLCMLTAI